jgi:CheR methyltransferase, SAM binding domain
LVPACATGEEAYPIAILLKQAMEKRGVAFQIQIWVQAGLFDRPATRVRWRG